MRLHSFVLFVVGFFASAAYAEPIANPGKNYSFDFPEGWSLDPQEKYFTVRAGAGLSISELNTPPSGMDLSVTSLTVHAVALAAGLCGNVVEKNIRLTGKKWQGDAFLCDMPETTKAAGGQELFLTVKHGSDLNVFRLSMPAGTWPQQKKTYISLLKSLRFGRR